MAVGPRDGDLHLAVGGSFTADRHFCWDRHAVRSIYLDYNASTPLAPIAQEAMLPYLADRFADPTGDYPAGRAVAEALEDARARVASAVGVSAAEIVWTSGGTESCNLALRGTVEAASRAGERPHLIVTAADHAAVQGPARYLASIGADLTVAPCDSVGVVDPQAIADSLRPDTRLVSVVHASDEIGAVQPIEAIAGICRDNGVPLHVDASQSLGKLPLDAGALGADLMSLSAHKAYGPKGVGALFLRAGTNLDPLLIGEGQEGGLRGGTPNVAGVVGFGHVATLASASVVEAAARMASLRDRFTERLLSAVGDGRVYGPNACARLANTAVVALPGAPASDLLTAAPEVVAKACASSTPGLGGVSISPALQAIGADPDEAIGATRFTVGWYTDDAEVDDAADAFADAWRRIV